MTGRYDDIINLPHHVSSKHPRMSMQDRAAQFVPFAALRGHSDAIREVCRYVDAKIELTGPEQFVKRLRGKESQKKRKALCQGFPLLHE